MADTLQKHLNGTDDTAIKAALVPKELGFNETDRSAVYKHEDGITFDKLPSESKLAETSTESGAALIGLDDSDLDELSATQLQEFAKAVDDRLKVLIPVEFTDLNDTPSSYTGESGKLPRVNSTEDALEYSELQIQIEGNNGQFDGGKLAFDIEPYQWIGVYDSFDMGFFSSFYSRFEDEGFVSNAYFDGSDWISKSDAKAGQRNSYEKLGDRVEYVCEPTTAGDVIAWIETKRTDVNGNIAYNGARIPEDSDLDLTTYTYQFWGWKSIATKKTGSQETVVLNGYLSAGGIVRSLNASGFVAYSSMNDAQIVNRRSTAASTAQDQQMTVTDPLPIA